MSDQADAMRTLLDHWGWALPRSDYGWQSVRCGNHDDRHASARVNMEEGSYICLACGIHAGSPYGLVGAVERLEGRAAFDFLRRIGAPVGDGVQEMAPSGPRRPWKGRKSRKGSPGVWRRAH